MYSNVSPKFCLVAPIFYSTRLPYFVGTELLMLAARLHDQAPPAPLQLERCNRKISNEIAPNRSLHYTIKATAINVLVNVSPICFILS